MVQWNYYKMLKRFTQPLNRVLYLILVIISLKAIALSSHDGVGSEITIKANTAQFDEKKGIAIYIGDVRVKKDHHHLLADKLTLRKDKTGKIDLIIAIGHPAKFVMKKESQKHPIEGKANTLHYFPKEEKLILLNSASLTQNLNTVEGEHLTYFLSAQTLSSEPVPGKHTTVTLFPEDNHLRQKDIHE